MKGNPPRLGHAQLAWLAVAVVLGAWLRWPSLGSGFFSDDYVEPAMLEGAYPSPRAPLDLFNFADGSAQDNARLQRFGALPWWAAPGLRLSMLRPLSSALVIFDREVLGSDALLAHVHSMLWWVLLMGAAALLLYELFPLPIAGLALLIFALEEGHGLPVAWLANRGALVAMALGLLGLLAHVRHRRRGGAHYAVWSCLAFCTALLAGEWAFPLLGYVLAFEALGMRDSLRTRARALLPAAVPGLVFLFARGALGYGVLRSGVYIDPVTEPVAFAVAALQRIPVFFADLFLSVPADWWGTGTPWRDQLLSLGLISPSLWVRLPSWRFWHVTIGVCAMLLSVLTLRSGLRGRPDGLRQEIRWLLAGALLSLLPMVASFPTSRLVLPAALAASAASAILISHAFELLRARSRSSWPTVVRTAWLALLVAYFQVWEAGRTSWGQVRIWRDGYASVRAFMEDAEIDDTLVAGQRVVLLSAIEHTTAIFTPFARWFYGHPLPRSCWVLSAAPQAHDIYRPAPNVLELSVLGGTLLTTDLERLYRADRFAFAQGDRIAIDGLEVEVLRAIEGRPQWVRFTFEHDVDDPSYVFLTSTLEGLARARLPEVGGRIRQRRAAFPNAKLQRAARLGRDPVVTCTGGAPPIDECRVGHFVADCGGDAAPRFACHGIGDCRWFSGGCVAEGYVVSTCAVSAPCCHAGSPFPRDSFLAEPTYRRIVARGLSQWGLAPWDTRTGLVADVLVDPRLAQTQPSVQCEGPGAERGPCDLGLLDIAPPQQSSLRFAFAPPRATEGWRLTVEVIDGRDGRLRARVCRVPQLAVAAYAAPEPECGSATAPICAVSGSVTLRRFPIDGSQLPGLAARLQAEFPDGLRVRAQL